MSDTKDLVAEAAAEMDEIMAPVMPVWWVGHARTTINDADLTEKQRDFALRLSEKHLEKNPDAPAGKVGSAAVKQARDKL